jgi:hypothetical protein
VAQFGHALPRFAEPEWNVPQGCQGSDPRNVCRADHFGPLFGFLCDELSKAGGRAWKHCATQVGKPSLQFGLGEARVDLLVEPVDNLAGVFLGTPIPYQVLAS